MNPFTLAHPRARVRFGRGLAVPAVVEEVDRLGARRAMIIASERHRGTVDRVIRSLGSTAVGRYSQVRQHVPTAVAQDVVRAADAFQADAVISVGGGSATGTAKIVARDRGVPIVAVPTTFAGSEMTPVWGETTDGVKRTGVDPLVAPVAVVYDPELFGGLDPRTRAESAFNALAHCVEASWSPGRNPIVALEAAEGLRVLPAGLVHADDDDDLVYGAMLGGVCYAQVGSGVHHRLCHALGGAFDLPHAALHAVMIVAVVSVVAERDPDAVAPLARAWNVDDVASAIAKLADDAGVARTLVQIGLPRTSVQDARRLVRDRGLTGYGRVDADAVDEMVRRAAGVGE